MKTSEFKYNGATITVREELGFDVFARPAIHNIILQYLQKKHNATTLPNGIWFAIMGYERIVSRTVKIEGHLAFELPSPNAADEAIIAGYEAVMSAPGDLIDAWNVNLNAVNKTPLETQVEGKPAGE